MNRGSEVAGRQVSARKQSIVTAWRWCAAIVTVTALAMPASLDVLAGPRRAGRHNVAAAVGRGRVEGSVITMARHPVGRALVRLRSAVHVLRYHRTGRHAARTGPRGHFAIKAPAGRYLVVASKRGLGRTTAFTTVVPGQTRPLTLTLRAPCVVHGRVLHRHGQTTEQPSRNAQLHPAPRPSPSPPIRQPVLPPSKLPPPKPSPQPH